jgi:hypothetical protein
MHTHICSTIPVPEIHEDSDVPKERFYYGRIFIVFTVIGVICLGTKQRESVNVCMCERVCECMCK